MFSLPVILKCAVLAAFAGLRNAPEVFERPWRGPVFGYCDSKSLYISDDRANSRGGSNLFRQPLGVSTNDEKDRTERFSVAMQVDGKRLYRWRIIDQVFFGGSAGLGPNDCVASRVPLADLDLFDDSNPIPFEKRRDQRAKRYPFDRDLFHIHCWWLDPLERLYEKARDTRPHQFTEVIGLDGSVRYNLVKEPFISGVFRDELPVGKDKLKLFVLEDRSIQIWEGSFVLAKNRPDDPNHIPA